MFCKIFFSNKFGFILEIVFSYTGAQQNLWIMLPTLAEIEPKLLQSISETKQTFECKSCRQTSPKHCQTT